MNDDDFELSNVTPIRRLQPGDLLDVVKKFRALMGMYDTCSYTLYASFEDLEPGLEKEAAKTRHTLELAAARIDALLTLIERHPSFAEMRREALAHRKAKAERIETS